MGEEEEKTWAWLMPGGKVYRVVTNPVEGTIKVYDPTGKLAKQDEKLSREAVKIIERNFLETVATKVRGKETETVKEAGNALPDEIGMYIR
ncbi:MAG: hypothetical protein WBC40_05485 [Halobacteriota archaeon]